MFKRFALVLCLSLMQWNGIAVDVLSKQDESKVCEKADDQRPQDRRQGGQQRGERGPGNKGNGGKGGGSGLGNYTEPPPANNVPEHLYNILLGRPTDSSITIRVLFHKEAKVFVEYGRESGKLPLKTPVANIAAIGTSDFDLKELKGNSRYLGNHDGESGNRGSTVWATKTRKRLFPNPQPDLFYTGNDKLDPEVGLLEDYYQW